MTDGNGGNGGNGSGQSPETQAVLAQLAETGFFQQFTSLEENLRIIASDLKTLGTAATDRIQETESLAVHMLAVEAVVLTLLKKYPLEADDIKATARVTTGQPDSADGNPAVMAVIDDLLTKAR